MNESPASIASRFAALKDLIAERWRLPDDVLVMIVEQPRARRSARLPATVIVLLREGHAPIKFTIGKPVTGISVHDLNTLAPPALG